MKISFSLVKRIFILLVVCSFFTYYNCISPRPNIVFILADDLGYHDIGYHNSEIISPNIDYLANTGVRLEQYYTQPTCTPTRTSLLTGRYSIHTGFQHIFSIQPSWPIGLSLNLTLLPQELKKLDYATHIVGKWHIGYYQSDYLPCNRGFDSHFGYYMADLDYFEHTCWDVYPHPTPSWALDLHNTSGSNSECVFDKNGTYSMKLYAHEAVRIIEQHDADIPLFLYLPLQTVHQPNQVPEMYEKYYPQIETINRRKLSGMVTAMDDAILEVYEALRAKSDEFLNNTVIIFASDNGGWPIQSSTGSNYPLRGGKWTLFEGGIRVPAFVNSALINNSSRIEYNMIHVSDWYPTILAIAGLTAKDLEDSYYPWIDGINQWPLISQGENENVIALRHEIIHNIDPIDDQFITSALRSGSWKILTGRWANCSIYSDPIYCSWMPVPGVSKSINETSKLQNSLFKQSFTSNIVYSLYKRGIIKRDYSPVLLFYLENDPREMNDLSNKYPEILETMLQKLDYYFETMVDPITVPETTDEWKTIAQKHRCLVPWDIDN